MRETDSGRTSKGRVVHASASSSHNKVKLLLLIVLFLGSLVLSMTLGRYDLSPHDILDIVTGRLTGGPVTWSATAENVLWQVRMPRVIAAVIVGAALAGAGSVFQGLFRNPMVSPDLLGASAGACFGAALGILFSFSNIGVEILAFAMGLLAVFVACTLASAIGRHIDDILALVLSGMVIGNLFQAFTSAVKFVADPNSKLPEITFWLMGSLANVHRSDLPWLIAMFVIGTVVVVSLRWRLNIMSCGDEEALSMGVDVKRTRRLAIIAATLLTSASIAVAGMVGWVGLIIPHLTRFVFGSDHRLSVPASMLMGGTFLLVVDDICRSIYTTEIPLSILTSLIGAPLFIYLILRTRKGR